MPRSNRLRARTKALLIVSVFTTLLALLFIPIGPSGCSGLSCFTVGPFNGPGGGGLSAQASLTVLFPGQVSYTDGSSSSLAGSQNVMSVLAGPKKVPVASVSVGVQFVANDTISAPLSFSYSGYVHEIIFRSRTDPAGVLLVTEKAYTFSATVPLTLPSTTIALLTVSHPAADLSAFVNGNLTHYSYALTGSFNFTFGAPINRTAAAIWSWPNLAVNIGNATGGGSTGGPSCSKGICPMYVANLPAGARYTWFALGTAPTFSVAKLQVAGAPNASYDAYILVTLLLM